MLLYCKAQGNRRAAKKGGLPQRDILKAHFGAERGGIQPSLNLLSFKAQENHGDSEAFVPPTLDSNYGISAVYQERIWSGTSGNKSTSEALSAHQPRGKALAKHKTSPCRGQGDSEGHSLRRGHALGLSCLELPLLPEEWGKLCFWEQPRKPIPAAGQRVRPTRDTTAAAPGEARMEPGDLYTINDLPASN